MNPVPLPKDLPLLVGKTPSLDNAVATILSRGNPSTVILIENLIILSTFVRVKVWFNCPVEIRKSRWKIERVTEVIIGKFFNGTTGFGYTTRHNKVRSGYNCGWVNCIIRYEPVFVPSKAERGFSSLEAFTRKFDPRFIAPDFIKKLYEGTSAQHGGKYIHADFHRIGPRGKEVLERFLRGFKGLDVDTPFYCASIHGDKCLSEHYSSYTHTGRDITIEHKLGSDRIYYSSEYPGCGNGRYGILANMKEFLWLEDD